MGNGLDCWGRESAAAVTGWKVLLGWGAVGCGAQSVVYEFTRGLHRLGVPGADRPRNSRFGDFRFSSTRFVITWSKRGIYDGVWKILGAGVAIILAVALGVWFAMGSARLVGVGMGVVPTGQYTYPSPSFPTYTPFRYSAAPSPQVTVLPCPHYVPSGGWLYSPAPPPLVPTTLPNGQHACVLPGGVPPAP
jgi:hypothetical protein